MIGLVLKEDNDRDLTIESINRDINRSHEILAKNQSEFNSHSITNLLKPEDTDLHDGLMKAIESTLNQLDNFSSQVNSFKQNKETDEKFSDLVQEQSQSLTRQYNSMLSIAGELSEQNEELKNNRSFSGAAFALDNVKELTIDSSLKRNANTLREGSYQLKQLEVPLSFGNVNELIKTLGIAPSMMAIVNYAYKEAAKPGVSNEEILKFAGTKAYQLCYQGLADRLVMNEAFHNADKQLMRIIVDYLESRQDELNEYLTSLDN